MIDIEGIAEALAITIYEAVNDDLTHRTPWNYLPPGECEKWRRAANAITAPSNELKAIHAVIMCIGCDWPEDKNDPYTLHHVKRMARELNTCYARLKEAPYVPLTQAQVEAFAHRRATKYTHRSDSTYHSYAFVPHTLMDFVGDVERALRGAL